MSNPWLEQSEDLLIVGISHEYGAGEEYYIEVVDDVDMLSYELMARIDVSNPAGPTPYITHQTPLRSWRQFTPAQVLHNYILDHVVGQLEAQVTRFKVSTATLWAEGTLDIKPDRIGWRSESMSHNAPDIEVMWTGTCYRTHEVG